ncbi:hypothetical protein I8748_20120 [Nostoc sp. CENA67]|uniref:Uncharacterized protein n=1 Tax=Amazonocrinis nigriterrae CENA67 TaxID=2794033 RepID=A0A8J7L9T6_9NOST|nr:hypothetical protein [Amazonocrinis nigriterrae]MBH8564460.1 hypothetical protein [Amazonocrinis nigriterrae CENA67]
MPLSLSQPDDPDTAKKKLLRQRGGYSCWPGSSPSGIFGHLRIDYRESDRSD